MSPNEYEDDSNLIITGATDVSDNIPRLDQNNLIYAVSPYLLQHSTNLVHWQEWSPQILDIAQGLGHPLFISIGYSTCHWCHVMEEESFADGETAQILNEHFIPIKIDREERPDLDSYYMNTAQMMGVSGGWPLNIFADSNGVPFWVFTYAPPEDRHGLSSFKNLLRYFSEEWEKSKTDIISRGVNNAVLLKQYFMNRASGNENASEEIIEEEKPNPLKDYFMKQVEFFEVHEKYFDSNAGGFKFQARVKFPHLINLAQLLRLAHFWLKPSLLSSLIAKPSLNINTATTLSGEKLVQTTQCLNMVVKSVLGMLRGGMYDHVGGGLFRYSTDYGFHIPHFEKMLYDNALFLELLSDVYLVFSDIMSSLINFEKAQDAKAGSIVSELKKTLSPYYRLDEDNRANDTAPQIIPLINNFLNEIVREINRTITYYEEEMSGSNSHLTGEKTDYFFAAQDAGDKMSEGAYYTWGCEEIKNLILNSTKSAKQVTQFFEHFILHPFSNPHNRQKNNLPSESTFHIERKSPAISTEQDELDETLVLLRAIRGRDGGRLTLQQIPFKDHKLITSWNAMMVVGYLKTYRIFKDERVLVKSRNVLEYIFNYCRIPLTKFSHNHYTKTKKATTKLTNPPDKVDNIDTVLLHCVVPSQPSPYAKGSVSKYIPGFLSDYVELARCCLIMYKTTGEISFHQKAITLVDEALHWFYHKHEDGISCSETSILHDGPLLVMEDPYDGIEHSSPALLAHLLLELSVLNNPEITDTSKKNLTQNNYTRLSAERFRFYYEQAENILTKFYPLIGSTSMSSMTTALFHYQTGIKTITYHYNNAKTKAKSVFENYFSSHYFPDWILLRKPLNTNSTTTNMTFEHVIVCDEKQCSPPLKSPTEVNVYLNKYYQSKI